MATAKWCRKQQIYNMADKTPFVVRDRALTMSRTRRKEYIYPLNYSSQSKSTGARSKTTYRAARRNAEREARRKNRR